MRRPQSANHHRNYIAPSTDEAVVAAQSNRHFVKQGRRAMFNPMTASNDLSRLLPKKIQQDKERLYCETLQLKTNLNEISEENLRLKTKIATLQKEKDRLNKTEEPTLGKGKSANFSNLHSKGEKENGIVSGLKKIVRETKQQNENLKNELTKIKRSIRYTKINEVQIEKQTLLDQNKRLAKSIQQLEEILATAVRQDEQLKFLQTQLEQKMKQLKEVTADNIKYEEILEDMEIKNREVSQRLLVSERKWQRDLSVEKRKIEQLNRKVELLNHQISILNQKLQEEEKKKAQPKKISRPVSSHPYQNLDSNNLKNKISKQKAEALLINEKLKHELEAAKRKLAQSQNQLKKTNNQQVKEKLASSQDKTFELVLTKNEAKQFMRNQDNEEYHSDFDQSPKPSKNINELPLEERTKDKVAPQNQNPSKYSSPTLNEIKQILTYRMRYNRYPFDQLKSDIESSPLRSFTYQDLMSMLESQPFFLTKHYASEFLKVCFGKAKIKADDELESRVLIKNLRGMIEDFESVDEQEEERMLYQIAQFMTYHRSQLEKEFQKIKDKHNCITKTKLEKVLHQFSDINDQKIDLAICYISINAETLQAINYTDLLDRFYINSAKEVTPGKSHQLNKADELSMGQNQDLDEGELIADDELV